MEVSNEITTKWSSITHNHVSLESFEERGRARIIGAGRTHVLAKLVAQKLRRPDLLVLGVIEQPADKVLPRGRWSPKV